MASLTSDIIDHFCGGSLIASKESVHQHKRFPRKKSVNVFFFISVWLNISKVCPDSCSLHQDFKEFSQGWFIFFIIIFFAKGRFDRLHEISKFPQSFKVVLGEHDSDREDETFLETKRFRVKNVFVHEEYVGDFKNDSIGRVGGRHGPPP